MREFMQQEEKRLEEVIRETKNRLLEMPEGTFFTSGCGKQIRWFYYSRGKCFTIRKADRKFARALAEKKFLQHRLKEEETELEAVHAYLRNSYDPENERFLQENPELKRLLFDFPDPQDLGQSGSAGSTEDQIRHWAAADYRKSDIPFKGTLYKTLKGDLVKSAAERDIANALYLAGIPYRYECGISFDGGKNYIYPDFTIMHPMTGEIFLWEHFGMAELDYYRHKNANKMYVYFDHGYFPGRNLICTYASDTFSLTKSQIQETIAFYFN